MSLSFTLSVTAGTEAFALSRQFFPYNRSQYRLARFATRVCSSLRKASRVLARVSQMLADVSATSTRVTRDNAPCARIDIATD